jgi:RNA polymerase sigma-70 factor (ECF subfamily)
MGTAREIPADGCFEGHERAFRQAFVRHYPAVRRLLAHVTRDRSEAEDLAQEVFVMLLHQRFEPDREHDLRRWLLRVALNRGLNAVRGGRRRDGRERGATSPHVYDLEAAVARREVQQEVRAVLAALEPRAAKLLMLHQLGLSHAELAEIVDVAPGSVGTLLTRAKRAFITSYKRKDRRATEESSQ